MSAIHGKRFLYVFLASVFFSCLIVPARQVYAGSFIESIKYSWTGTYRISSYNEGPDIPPGHEGSIGGSKASISMKYNDNNTGKYFSMFYGKWGCSVKMFLRSETDNSAIFSLHTINKDRGASCIDKGDVVLTKMASNKLRYEYSESFYSSTSRRRHYRNFYGILTCKSCNLDDSPSKPEPPTPTPPPVEVPVVQPTLIPPVLSLSRTDSGSFNIVHLECNEPIDIDLDHTAGKWNINFNGTITQRDLNLKPKYTVSDCGVQWIIYLEDSSNSDNKSNTIEIVWRQKLSLSLNDPDMPNIIHLHCNQEVDITPLQKEGRWNVIFNGNMTEEAISLIDKYNVKDCGVTWKIHIENYDNNSIVSNEIKIIWNFDDLRELAIKHRPILHFSTSGSHDPIDINLYSETYKYSDYIPIDVHDITTSSKNTLPEFVFNNRERQDLLYGDINDLGSYNNTTSYINFSPLYDGRERIKARVEKSFISLNRHPTVYYRVFHDESRALPYAIEYWFFYFANWWDVADTVQFTTIHPGDWEMISVFLNSDKKPVESVYSTHFEANRHSVRKDSGRLDVYVSHGGHGSYNSPGETNYDWKVDIFNLFTDYHLGDGGILDNYNLVDLEVIEKKSNKSGWVWFSKPWGSESSAPKGPLYRTDAPTPIQHGISINKPKNAINCMDRLKTNITKRPSIGSPLEGNIGPWEWASGYALGSDNIDNCIPYPIPSGGGFNKNTDLLTLYWTDSSSDRHPDPDINYHVILRNIKTGKEFKLRSCSVFDFDVGYGCTNEQGREIKFREFLTKLDGGEYKWWVRAEYYGLFSEWSNSGFFKF